MKLNLQQRIGMRIQECRQEMGFTQAELAEKANLSTSYISHVECGKKMVSIKSLVAIVNALNVTVDGMLYGIQKADNTSYQIEMDIILSECSNDMKRMIYWLVKSFLKFSKENGINI